MATKLRPVIRDLQKTYDEVEVLFVNDGSTDDTEELLRREFTAVDYVHIISYKNNRGLGGAIRIGFKHADGDFIVTIDFDGTYDFATIPNILEYLKDDSVDVVTASPYHPLGGVEGIPKYRLVFSFGASLLYRALIRQQIYTWTALYRAYRRPVIENTTFESNGFLFNTELLINAIFNGYRVKEFPTILYTREFGQSSMRVLQVTLLHLKYQATLLTTANCAQFMILITSTMTLALLASLASFSQTLSF